ncbi:MAG: energy-coupling factor transporter ATPase [Ruminococcaceae bacterium]|nr:energy-coupling factor transporter ATPase [Oscillospiraceae bacterium]
MSDVRIEDLGYYHGKDTPYEIKALDEINLDIKKGIITGLIGHTGSGKSTLVQMLNGILKPHHGRVLLDGTDIWSKPKDIRKIRFRVGLVMQYPEYQLFEETIYKDIAYGPKNMGLDEKEIDERVREAAEFAGLAPELLERSPFDLSGGQKRRAAIAGIIAMRPELLVLDEPAAGLDPRGRDSIFKNISDYQKKSGSTVLIVSHSMEDMARYCQRLIVMSGGKIVLEGECREVFAKSDILESVGLDVPQITKLVMMLREKGIELDPSVYTVQEAFEKIIELYK